jgi:hypothetical protein
MTDMSFHWQVKTKGSSIWEYVLDTGCYVGSQTNELIIKEAESYLDQNWYRCEYSVSCNKSRDTLVSDSVILIVHPLPVDTLVVKGKDFPVVLISPDSGGVYKWFLNDRIIPGANGQYYYPPGGVFKPGLYNARIVSKYGCVTETKKVKISTLRSTTVNVYPNPAAEKLFVKVTGEIDSKKIFVTVRNLGGALLISTSKPVFSEEIITVPVDKLTSGSYLIDVKDSEGSIFYSGVIIIQ